MEKFSMPFTEDFLKPTEEEQREALSKIYESYGITLTDKEWNFIKSSPEQESH